MRILFGILIFKTLFRFYHSTHVYVVGFSDRLTEKLCLSIQSAALVGLDYYLITKLQNAMTITGQEPKILKVTAYMETLQRMNSSDVVLFADSFDVLFQRLLLPDEYGKLQTVLFNAETGCYPYTHPFESVYYCPLMQGRKYLKDRRSNIPIGCQLQKNLSPKSSNVTTVYLNSGVSLGTVRRHLKIYNYVIHLSKELPKLCMEDQGLISWMYATKVYKSKLISLDFHAHTLAAMYKQNRYYSFDQSTGLWTHREGYTPAALHFNGDKLIMDDMLRTMLKWHRKKYGVEKINDILNNTLIHLDDKLVRISDICRVNRFG